MATALLHLANKRHFIAEACVTVILDMLDQMAAEEAGEVLNGCEALQAVLKTRAEDATADGLLLVLHVWPILPKRLQKHCPLLPADAPAPSRALYKNEPNAKHHKQGDDDSAASAAFFRASHLEKLQEAARNSSVAAPRLHAMWLHLLRLLLPNFQMSAPCIANTSEVQMCALPTCTVCDTFQDRHSCKAPSQAHFANTRKVSHSYSLSARCLCIVASTLDKNTATLCRRIAQVSMEKQDIRIYWLESV
jgi:hypothetical protein